MKRDRIIYILLGIALLLFFGTAQATVKDFTVVIDAGHGGKDPGARNQEINEKEINLNVALKLGHLIESHLPDVNVIYTRKRDNFVELDERADIANRNKADLFISIHTNSIPKNTTISGTEIYTLGLARTNENLDVAMRENSAILLEDNYKERYEGFDPNSSESYIIFEFMQNKHVEQSVNFASKIKDEFEKAHRTNRNVRQAGFLVLRKTSMPSVLVELGYLTNSTERHYLMSSAGQDRLATSIYNAFAKYKWSYDLRRGIQKSSDQKPVLIETRDTTIQTATRNGSTSLPEKTEARDTTMHAMNAPLQEDGLSKDSTATMTISDGTVITYIPYVPSQKTAAATEAAADSSMLAATVTTAETADSSKIAAVVTTKGTADSSKLAVAAVTEEIADSSKLEASVTTTKATDSSKVTIKKEEAKVANEKGKTIYKVQILTSNKILSSNSRLLKGYKGVSHYYEKGVYKYTYGSTDSFSEIKQIYRRVQTDFKDAFIIGFKDGVKKFY